MIRLRWIYADYWRGIFNLRMSGITWKVYIILPNYLVHFLNFYKKDKTIVWVCLVTFRTKLDTSDIRHITTTHYVSYTQNSCNMGLNMITSSNGNIFRVTGPSVTSEFPSQKPITQSFDVFLNKTIGQIIVRLVIWDAVALIMT